MLLSLATRWAFDPTVIAGLLAVSGLYWLYVHRPPAKHADDTWQPRDAAFISAMLLTLLALESPLDYISDRYLFSAHMLQHLILLLAVAPLLVVAAPPALARRLPAWLLRPSVALVLFTVDVWLWHLPFLYDEALLSESLHALEHLTFIATGCLFWWVALRSDLPPLLRMLYVFVGGIPQELLGVVLTFARPLYPFYRQALDAPGIGRALQVQFGLTVATDQQLGGLLMWIVGGIVFLAIVTIMFIAWCSGNQAEDSESLGPARVPLAPSETAVAGARREP